MSRTSSAERLRYATIGPSVVTAAAVGQHSQTRRSIGVLGQLLPGAVEARGPQSHVAGAVRRPGWRPASSRGRRARRGRDRRRCRTATRSRAGCWCRRGAAKTAPTTYARRRSIARGGGRSRTPVAPFICSQCATSVRSASRTTDGTSAKLAKKSSPNATRRASDQPAAVRSENLSAVCELAFSSQLRIDAVARRRQLRLRACRRRRGRRAAPDAASTRTRESSALAWRSR